MGIKSMTSNKKKIFKSRKSTRWHRTLKAEKKKHMPAESVNIENIHLYSQEKMKNKLRNPKNNIKISGKKFRRLTKRLGHSLREKSQMDIEVTDSRSKKGRINETTDRDMAEVNAETTTPSGVTSTTLPMPTSSRKKRRGGKKHKKTQSAGETNKEEKLFDDENAWEDVEMGDS